MFPYWDLASIISPRCTASDFVRTRGGLGQDTRHTRGSFPTRLGPAFAQLMHSNHPLHRLHSLQTSQYIRYIRDPKGILEKFDSNWNVTYDRKQICSEMYAIAKITYLFINICYFCDCVHFWTSVVSSAERRKSRFSKATSRRQFDRSGRQVLSKRQKS